MQVDNGRREKELPSGNAIGTSIPGMPRQTRVEALTLTRLTELAGRAIQTFTNPTEARKGQHVDRHLQGLQIRDSAGEWCDEFCARDVGRSKAELFTKLLVGQCHEHICTTR